MPPSEEDRSPKRAPSVAKGRSASRRLIGWREWVLLPELTESPLKAKIDTGAQTSSLHATRLKVRDDGMAEFEIHPVQRSNDQSQRVRAPVVGYRRVRSSTGHAESRPVISTDIALGADRFPIELTLTSRDQMGFRMLIGRAALSKRFVVDPGRSFLQSLEDETGSSV